MWGGGGGGASDIWVQVDFVGGLRGGSRGGAITPLLINHLAHV